ncbi:MULTISPECIES: hypothetical protein [unclassified Nocardioides]|uniref:hypothetical protein n=1 Tax=unclassified Nocardioides TaxID=2615069 RepID=UPI00361C8F7B
MVSTDPQAVAWSLELRSSGRVCVDVRRGRSLLYLVVAVWMDLIAVGLLVFTDVAGRVVGGLLLALGLAMFTMSFMQLFRVGSWRSPHVAVDADGIDVRRGWLRVPWSELGGAVAYTANHNRWVTIGLSAECYHAWLAQRSWPVRLLGRRSRQRHGAVNLPPNLAVDNVEFARWLTDEAVGRLQAELERLRHGLDVPSP